MDFDSLMQKNDTSNKNFDFLKMHRTKISYFYFHVFYNFSFINFILSFSQSWLRRIISSVLRYRVTKNPNELTFFSPSAIYLIRKVQLCIETVILLHTSRWISFRRCFNFLFNVQKKEILWTCCGTTLKIYQV